MILVMEPFFERVLSGLEKANEGMTDVEAKGVIQKACNELSNISKQLMDYKRTYTRGDY